MANKTIPPIVRIDLETYKLHLNLPGQQALSFHFDTSSRRFYLCVIALVVEEMKKNNRLTFVPLEDHTEILALLNETVGGGAGSSKKQKLLSRIYRKWKSALPDLENAPLFNVIGRKKEFDDASGKAYRFDMQTTDIWANLFEYKGSVEKVRLRFSVEKFGVELQDVVIVYGDPSHTDQSGAWERFIEHLRVNKKTGIQEENKKNAEQTALRKPVSEGAGNLDGGSEPLLSSVEAEPVSRESFRDWLEKQGGIEKIPLTTRLKIIAHLAMAPGDHQGVLKQDAKWKADEEISEIRLGSLPASGNNALYMAPELKDGDPPSPRSEVYALGVLLFQVVVGDCPGLWPPIGKRP